MRPLEKPKTNSREIITYTLNEQLRILLNSKIGKNQTGNTLLAALDYDLQSKKKRQSERENTL